MNENRRFSRRLQIHYSNSNGEVRGSNQAGLMYVGDVCLFVEYTESLQRVCDNVSAVIEEYGLKVNEKKSQVICLNGVMAVFLALLLLKQKSVYGGQ